MNTKLLYITTFSFRSTEIAIFAVGPEANPIRITEDIIF